MNSKVFQKIQVIRDQAEADVANVTAKADRGIERVKRQAQANEEAARQVESLRRRLEDEYETQTHPKRDLLWSKAWEHGHACGEAEVAHWYSEFAELVM